MIKILQDNLKTIKTKHKSFYDKRKEKDNKIKTYLIYIILFIIFINN